MSEKLPTVSPDAATQLWYEEARNFGDMSHNVALFAALRGNYADAAVPFAFRVFNDGDTLDFPPRPRAETELWRDKIEALTGVEVSEVCELLRRPFYLYRKLRIAGQAHDVALVNANETK